MDVSQKLALFVPPLDSNFDPKIPPETGEEYLQRVLYERKHICADVVSVSRDEIKLKKTSWKHLNIIDAEDNKAPVILLPSLEWQKIQVDEFQRLRQKVIELRKIAYRRISENLPVLPNITSENDWIEYCTNNPPLLTTMMRIDQRTLEKLLEILIEYFEEKIQSSIDETVTEIIKLQNPIDLNTTDKWLSQWIYAGLACLRLPIEPDMHSILRDIARSCIKLRNSFSSNDEIKVLPLNLLICIISHNFNQLDLSDCISNV